MDRRTCDKDQGASGGGRNASARWGTSLKDTLMVTEGRKAWEKHKQAERQGMGTSPPDCKMRVVIPR